MAMDHEAAVVLIRSQERLSDPEEIVFILPIEGALRVNAGMHEKSLAIVVGQGKASEPIDVVFGNLVRTLQTVAFERLAAAIIQPALFEEIAVRSRNQEILVVSFQVDVSIGVRSLKLQKEFIYAPVSGPRSQYC